jgi:hypothetical protein
MGKKQSFDNAWDFLAMSNYNTITSLGESPKNENVIYAGTDDGLIQVTENGGESWTKIPVSKLPGVPSTAFVNDIKADLFDENKVYICLDNHKFGDFRPFVYVSSDKGKTWKNIMSNLPEKTLVWRIVQDHVNKDLFFLATEFGVYFTINAGEKWVKLKGGLPTISFRDLAIQRRENDLVAASFGRSFYVLDDYSALRNVSEEQLSKEATLFSTRKAWWYFKKPHLSFWSGKGSMGASHFIAENPPFGAVFTYYLKDGYKTSKEKRKEKEKQLEKQKANIPFPGWEAVEDERREHEPKIILTIRDKEGNVVNRVYGPAKKGFHRVAWDLRYPAPYAIDYDNMREEDDDYQPRGMMCAPGVYTVSMSKMVDGKIEKLSDAREFEVVRLREGALEGNPMNVTNDFWREYEAVYGQTTALSIELSNAVKRINAMEKALSMSKADPGELDENILTLKHKILDLNQRVYGQPDKLQMGEKTKPDINQRLFALNKGVTRSAYGPTDTHRETMSLIHKELGYINGELDKLNSELDKTSDALIEAGAPYVEGAKIDID